MIDTHAHIGLCKAPASEIVAAAAEAGVRRILTIGLGDDSNPEVVALARKHEAVFASVGRHPNGAEGFDDASAEAMRELCADPLVRAVGETGLDFYRDTAEPAEQRRAFAAQIQIAREAGLPLILHLRDPEGSEDAVTEAFATLDHEAEGVEIVLHCFSAGPAWAERAAERGWHCSFAGNVTYPKAGALREAAAIVPDDLLLVETDAPYLAPQPVRGRPNQPANVVATAERVAEVRGVPYTRLESVVEANAARLFGW